MGYGLQVAAAAPAFSFAFCFGSFDVGGMVVCDDGGQVCGVCLERAVKLYQRLGGVLGPKRWCPRLPARDT